MAAIFIVLIFCLRMVDGHRASFQRRRRHTHPNFDKHRFFLVDSNSACILFGDSFELPAIRRILGGFRFRNLRRIVHTLDIHQRAMENDASLIIIYSLIRIFEF